MSGAKCVWWSLVALRSLAIVLTSGAQRSLQWICGLGFPRTLPVAGDCVQRGTSELGEAGWLM